MAPLTLTGQTHTMVRGLGEWAHSALKFPEQLCGAEAAGGSGRAFPTMAATQAVQQSPPESQREDYTRAWTHVPGTGQGGSMPAEEKPLPVHALSIKRI